MDWLVTGTRGGKPGRWKLEAADESAARQKAIAGGVAVQEVRRDPAAQAAVAAPMVVEPSGVDPPRVDEPTAEPESSDEGPPLDAGGSFPTDQGLASDENASDAGDGLAALTPAPDEVQQAPAGKSDKSARSKGSVKAGKRKKSVWGIGAIAAGVLAAVTTFIATAHVASIPLCIVGLLLAALGIYFALKRKRAGLLLPFIGAIVCVAATFLVYTMFQRDHRHAVPTAQELEDQARAVRVAQANIHVQFISIRPAEGGKYAITFAYNCGASGMVVTRLDGHLRISDASSGQEIESLTILGQSFPQGLGTDPVKREDTWTLQPAVVQALQGDATRLKVEFDPF